MEITSMTISYCKGKAKSIRNREQDIIRELDQLDAIICNNFSSPNIEAVLLEYANLKTSSNQFTKKMENTLCFEQNVVGWKTENAPQNISST